MKDSELRLASRLPVAAHNGGLFISRGRGSHPVRTIDSHELIVVRHGALAMFEAAAQFRLGAGQALVLWPGRRHGGSAPYPPDLSFFWFHFALPRVSGAGTTELRIPQVLQARDPEKVTELCRRFLEEQESGAGPFMLSLVLLNILAELAPRGDEGLGPEARRHPLTARAQELIKIRALAPAFSTRALAAELRVNPDYLGQLFRQDTGHCVTDAVHEVRVRKARQLLLESRLGIKEIAGLSGFGDVAFFRRVFRRGTGTTPAAFRRLHGRLHLNTE